MLNPSDPAWQNGTNDRSPLNMDVAANSSPGPGVKVTSVSMSRSECTASPVKIENSSEAGRPDVEPSGSWSSWERSVVEVMGGPLVRCAVAGQIERYGSAGRRGHASSTGRKPTSP